MGVYFDKLVIPIVLGSGTTADTIGVTVFFAIEKPIVDAGQFYFFRTAVFLETSQLVGRNTIGIETDELEVQDIDTEQDWQLAELKYRLMIERG